MSSVVDLLKWLPEGYEKACFETKAIQRTRAINTPQDLMLLLLIHLQNGASLMDVSTIAELMGIGKFSDVAFMKRFEKCNEWFKWIISRLISQGIAAYEKPEWLKPYTVQAIDASDVVEKGRFGRTYRLHFALDLFTFHSVQHNITAESVGESLKNFEVRETDLMIGDRIYSTFVGMKHCLENKGNFVLRLRKNSFVSYNQEGERLDILSHLESLKEGETLDLTVYTKMYPGSLTPLRICAKPKDSTAKASTQKKLARKKSRKQEEISLETLEFNNYIVLITALPVQISAEQILQIYRWRWQVELYFKRLKSIMNFGQLPKKRPESVMAWLNGKLMIALILEKFVGEALFFPEESDELCA